MPNPTIVEAGNSRAHPVCDALQQRVHQLSFLIFPVFCLVKAGELHPARNRGSAPASTRSVATASEHSSATSRSGVLPMRSSSCAFTSAPAPKSTRMTSRCPFPAA
jgi:hypothetical protein